MAKIFESFNVNSGNYSQTYSSHSSQGLFLETIEIRDDCTDEIFDK